jgi:RNA polymerase sigma factor (sigma-70 family)
MTTEAPKDWAISRPTSLVWSYVALNPDDDALLAGMAAGDRDAAEVFVRRHAPSVIAVAYAVLGDRGFAEDASQETFCKAWRAAATYDPRRCGVRPWLMAISRNTAIDYLRMRRARPLDPHAVTALLADQPHNAAPDDGLLADAEAAEVRRALQRLPDQQRRALLLAAVGGRSAVEVSEVEGIPLGTAKTRIRNGLLRMRATLEVDTRRG